MDKEQQYQASDGQWSSPQVQSQNQQTYGQQPPMKPTPQAIYVDGKQPQQQADPGKRTKFGMCCGTTSALGMGACYY
ncbi:hypothetical protein V865_004924 [Kwoniella europaea PYCC6329]|uniref:Cysteine-rich transmembrane CYSTM domain-containing protein n=1 Tax=Kwoniella europaea PYCC6329 TaxID=1423913 RepID=A0AAX4KM81_9TREE